MSVENAGAAHPLFVVDVGSKQSRVIDISSVQIACLRKRKIVFDRIKMNPHEACNDD